MSDRKPEVRLTPALRVEIEVPRTQEEIASHRIPPADDTVRAFMDWVLSSHTYPLRGTASASPSFYSATFDASDRPAIEAWFADRARSLA